MPNFLVNFFWTTVFYHALDALNRNSSYHELYLKFDWTGSAHPFIWKQCNFSGSSDGMLLKDAINDKINLMTTFLIGENPGSNNLFPYGTPYFWVPKSVNEYSKDFTNHTKRNLLNFLQIFQVKDWYFLSTISKGQNTEYCKETIFCGGVNIQQFHEDLHMPVCCPSRQHAFLSFDFCGLSLSWNMAIKHIRERFKAH